MQKISYREQLKREYQKYQKSEWWKKRRAMALRSAGYKCVACSATKSL
jgi:hypothetical protein